MRLRAELTLRKEKTMSSVTKQFASLARGIRRIILHLSDALFTTRQSLGEPSLTIQTTSILKLKTLLSFINTGGRWQVELFFKWIKQHLRVKTFWGESENAVRIQIHAAIITYCLIGMIEQDMQIGRPIVEFMRILGSSLLTLDDVRDLLEPFKRTEEKQDDRQLCFNFQYD